MRFTEIKRLSRGGYTLVELFMVILIMGILAAAGVPRYLDAIAIARVDGAARRIAADLKLLRARAMMLSGNAEQQVDFDVATDSYTLVGTNDPDHRGQLYQVRLEDTGYPVDLVAAEFLNDVGHTSTTLKYDMYGSARAGDSPVSRITSGTIIVSSGPAQRVLSIDPITGEPRIQ